jgi:hypothetical protein
MEQVVSFLLKLTFYPVLFIGAWLSIGALYNWLRTCSCIKTTPCKAHLIVGIIAAVAVWFMAPGIPATLTSLPDWLALAGYGVCVFVGGRWVWRHRDNLLGWVKTTFECE